MATFVFDIEGNVYGGAAAATLNDVSFVYNGQSITCTSDLTVTLNERAVAMPSRLEQEYGKRLWAIYAHAVSIVSVLAVTVAVMFGGYDLVRIASPATTLNSALHEKYRSNETNTGYGTFKTSLTEDRITRERTLNYEKLLRMERRSGRQRLIKAGLVLGVLGILNVLVLSAGRRRYDSSSAGL